MKVRKVRVVEKPINGHWRWTVECKKFWGWEYYSQQSSREDAIAIAQGLMQEKVVWSSDKSLTEQPR